jgi:hypothetical protein
MATGIYGTIRAADVDVDDIDVFYTYSPNRETSNNTIHRLEASDVLQTLSIDNQNDELHLSGTDNLLEGLYDLTLPATEFNELGIYTIYIKPKTYVIEIQDCNVLSSLPNIRGLLLSKNDLPDRLQENNALQGYRIEYLETDTNTKKRNVIRHVVTSNTVVPVNENVGNTSQSSTRYRFDDTGTYLFLQVTPSTAPNVKPNEYPFIGTPGQIIKLTNTFFSPLVVEIEMVENTVQTLADFLVGEQIKDVKSGILTYYNKDRDIVKQYNLFQIKDSVEDVPLFEVKEIRQNIDTTQNFDDVIDGVNT